MLCPRKCSEQVTGGTFVFVLSKCKRMELKKPLTLRTCEMLQNDIDHTILCTYHVCASKMLRCDNTLVHCHSVILCCHYTILWCNGTVWFVWPQHPVSSQRKIGWNKSFSCAVSTTSIICCHNTIRCCYTKASVVTTTYCCVTSQHCAVIVKCCLATKQWKVSVDN